MPYFNHLCYLVAAIHIVLSDAIKEVDLLNADKFLKTFYSQYAELYGNVCSLWMSKSQFWMDSYINLLYILIVTFPFIGDNAATMKVHLLCHVVPCVRYWGPLWAYSCFSFEAMNQQIKCLFHGSRNMSKEVYLISFRNRIFKKQLWLHTMTSPHSLQSTISWCRPCQQ